MFPSKEMCYAEIHRRCRVNLADRDPVTANAAPVSPSSSAFGSNGY
jgi:hypothetical protein